MAGRFGANFERASSNKTNIVTTEIVFIHYIACKIVKVINAYGPIS